MWINDLLYSVTNKIAELNSSIKVNLVSKAGSDLNVSTSEKQDQILTELNKKTEPGDIQLGELTTVLRTLLLSINNPPYIDKSANAIRNQVQSGTITTVSTVTNLTNFGSQGADVMLRLTTLNAWAVNVRNLIT